MNSNGQMIRVVVFGAGGHGKVVVDAVQRTSSMVVADVVDDHARQGLKVLGHAVSGGRDALLERRGVIDGVIVAIGNNRIRMEIAQWLTDHGFILTSVVHPAAVVAPSAQIGLGTLVMPGAVINAEARIGSGVIVNSAAIVEHDCHVEEGAHIAPGAVLCGGVEIGAGTLIGAGAVVLPGIRIAPSLLVKAGTVVTRNMGLKD